METNKNLSPAKNEQEKKQEKIKQITERSLEKAQKEQPSRQELKGVEYPKKYTSGEFWAYGGIGALVAGIIGFFIGQSQGEKKAKEKYQYAVDTWLSKKEALREKRIAQGKSSKEDKEEPDGFYID